MSFQVNIPPSVVAKVAKVETEEADEPKKQTREDWKKLKELEEARKAGTAPAMQDEEGKDINPHIPQYIMQAPWYFGATTPTLRHQRVQEKTQKKFAGMNEWYKRGVKEGLLATKYRKGACENCGSLTHKKKDCLERPRRVGAKFTGEDIAPDEYIQPTLDMDYDGKRDRWNGYDTTEHERIVDEFAKLEEAKRELKSQKLDEDIHVVPKVEEGKDKELGDDAHDEDKYAEDMDMPGQKFETKQRITVRNLRIREDTAKYLYNLDVNSAFYDPKTRSMRENPFRTTGADPKELPYAGDNFVRYSGDAHEMSKQQIFAWEAYERGADVHLQADPTKLELLTKEYSRKKEDFKANKQQSVLDKYGGQEHLEAPPKQLLLAQSEDYVEYSRHGTVIKGQEKARIKSRFEEDVYINNHTSVWGSYWKEGQWGYKCCHSLIKGSYCTGQAGKVATLETIPALTDTPSTVPTELTQPVEETQEPVKPIVEQHTEKVQVEEKSEKKKKKKKKKNKRKKKKKRRVSSSESSSSESEDEEEKERKEKERRIKEALKREEERVKEVDRIMAMDERKRPYNSMYDVREPTEEEMEAFRMKRRKAEDPMSQFL